MMDSNKYLLYNNSQSSESISIHRTGWRGHLKCSNDPSRVGGGDKWEEMFAYLLGSYVSRSQGKAKWGMSAKTRVSLNCSGKRATTW